MAQQSEPKWIPTHVLTDAQLNDAGIIRGGPQKLVKMLEEAEILMEETSWVDFPKPALELDGVFTYLGPTDDPVVFSGGG